MSKEIVKQEEQGIVVGRQKYLPTTLKEFLTIYGIRKVKSDLRNVKTVKQALEVNTPSIGELKRIYGERQIEAYIKLWIIELNELLNVTRPLNEIQIDECSALIMSEHNNMSIADINLIFKRAKLGKYGELYGSLSIDKILKWFGDYFNDRCDVAGQMSRKEHDKIKYQNEKAGDRETNAEYRQKMREAVHDHNLQKMQEKYPKENKKENEKKG